MIVAEDEDGALCSFNLEMPEPLAWTVERHDGQANQRVGLGRYGQQRLAFGKTTTQRPRVLYDIMPVAAYFDSCQDLKGGSVEQDVL